MCIECNRINCPDACPGFREKSGESVNCYICGDAVLDGEERFRGYGVCICSECADTVDTDDLIDLCSFKNTAELLRVLGFCHCLD